MHTKKVLMITMKILLVCFLFSICMAVGSALSGLDRVAQQRSSSQVTEAAQASQQEAPRAQPAPVDIFLPFLIFSLCVGTVVSYLILRSSWHGWALAVALFAGIYGISTVTTQIESIVFLSSKLPRGMLRALFVQGAISAALFVPLAVLGLGRWRAAMPGAASQTPPRMSIASAAWRIAVLTIAFVFLYMFFGYYVAWQNPAVRSYYSGPDWPTFYASLKGNWQNSPWIFAVATGRALLYVAFVFPLIRMLRVARWESAMAAALFLSAWTTILLLPNPLMPASVARSHFWETLGFSLVFGTLLGWLLNTPPSTDKNSANAAR